MGRDSKNEERIEHYTKMVRTMMQTPAWRALSPVAQALYPWIKLEWKGSSANNNGKIKLSVRQAAQKLGVSRNTASDGFRELQAKGFLVVTKGARLGLGGSAKSPEFEVTELALPDQREGRRLYRGWQEGHDFPITKAMANNPAGRNGKEKACHKNEDSNVIKMKTNK